MVVVEAGGVGLVEGDGGAEVVVLGAEVEV